jgi:hypothetical protein
MPSGELSWSTLTFLSNASRLLCISSSDSDSDPEGGELIEFPFVKEEVPTKKKVKKKRVTKPTEERAEKQLHRKREVSVILDRSRTDLAVRSMRTVERLTCPWPSTFLPWHIGHSTDCNKNVAFFGEHP